MRAADRAREDVIEAPWSAVVLTAMVEPPAPAVNTSTRAGGRIRGNTARLRRVLPVRDRKTGVAFWGPPIVDPEGPPRMKFVKRAVIGLVIAFAVFYLVTKPQDAAGAVQGVVTAVWEAGVAVVDFLVALVAG